MALVSLGISVSYLYSIYAVIITYMWWAAVDFFFECFITINHAIRSLVEMKAIGEAGDAQALARVEWPNAHVVLKTIQLKRQLLTSGR